MERDGFRNNLQPKALG